MRGGLKRLKTSRSSIRLRRFNASRGAERGIIRARRGFPMRPSAARRERQKADLPTMGQGDETIAASPCSSRKPRKSRIMKQEERRLSLSLARSVERRRPGSASRSCLITARISRATTNCDPLPCPPPFPLPRYLLSPSNMLRSPPHLWFPPSTFPARFPSHRTRNGMV